MDEIVYTYKMPKKHNAKGGDKGGDKDD